ncbi:MAG: acyltransferase family protein [Bdellovibrionales bacterium]|nr:acyltransferase family protein [Bdellovibrionales bacterium]
MKNFKMPNTGFIEKLKELDTDSLLYRVMPLFIMEIMEKYFRLTIEGEENIPHAGRAIFTPNHSGYSGFDAMMLLHTIQQHTQQAPKVLTHHLWFLTKTTSIPANKLGFIEATKQNALKELKKNRQIILFPEGEYGNFKPSFDAYSLQEFKRGFIRIAIEANAPIIPTIIIGAEETHINLKQLKLTKYLRGLVLPLPLNIIPLPAKWKIIFLPPIHLPYKANECSNSELMNETAQDIREMMQIRIQKELKNRKSIYF